MRHSFAAEGDDVKCLLGRLFMFCSAVSLLLCVAVCVLWVRSYWRRDVFTLMDGHGGAQWVEMVRGGFQWVRFASVPADTYSTGWRVAPPTDALPSRPFIGFASLSRTIPLWDGTAVRQVPMSVVTIPAWFVAIFAGILPALAVSAMFQRRFWWRHGVCQKCGYDLRATPERCPECGALSPQKAT
jgi:hypothetical protein